MAQIQRNYFKPKRPKTNWSLAQIWAATHGFVISGVHCTVPLIKHFSAKQGRSVREGTGHVPSPKALGAEVGIIGGHRQRGPAQ